MDVVVLVWQHSQRLSSQHSTLITNSNGRVTNAFDEKSDCTALQKTANAHASFNANVALASLKHKTEKHVCIRL